MVVWYFVWAPRKLYRSIHKRIVHSSYDRSAAVLNAIVYLHPNHLRMHSTVYISSPVCCGNVACGAHLTPLCSFGEKLGEVFKVPTFISRCCPSLQPSPAINSALPRCVLEAPYQVMTPR